VGPAEALNMSVKKPVGPVSTDSNDKVFVNIRNGLNAMELALVSRGVRFF